jgi:hypothetical protein
MRRPDFPSPVRVIGSYKAYDLDQVADFLAIPANELQMKLQELSNHAV